MSATQSKHHPVFSAVSIFQLFYDGLRHGLLLVISSIVSSHQPLHCPGSDDKSRGNTMSTPSRGGNGNIYTVKACEEEEETGAFLSAEYCANNCTA
jgi:hypothetical protein